MKIKDIVKLPEKKDCNKIKQELKSCNETGWIGLDGNILLCSSCTENQAISDCGEIEIVVDESKIAKILHSTGLDSLTDYASMGKSRYHWEIFRRKLAKAIADNLPTILKGGKA